jgi:hypothetical protein
MLRPSGSSSRASTRRSSRIIAPARRRSLVRFQIKLENGDEELVIPAKNFTELDRLSCVVHLIEEECQIVPVGAIKILPTHELIHNTAFRGLKIEEGAKLSSYLHYRKPKSEEKKLIIGKNIELV